MDYDYRTITGACEVQLDVVRSIRDRPVVRRNRVLRGKKGSAAMRDDQRAIIVSGRGRLGAGGEEGDRERDRLRWVHLSQDRAPYRFETNMLRAESLFVSIVLAFENPIYGSKLVMPSGVQRGGFKWRL